MAPSMLGPAPNPINLNGGSPVLRPRPIRMLLAALLVVTAVVFAVASSAERRREGGESVTSGSPEAGSPESAEAGHSEAGEGAGATREKKEATKTLFGVRTESAAASVGVVLASLVAAGLALVARRRRLLWGIAAFALVFAALDLREAFSQSDLGNDGFMAVAIGLALAHGGAAVLAAVAGRTDSAPA